MTMLDLILNQIGQIIQKGLSGLKTFPATLNSLSTGADEAARHKNFLANLAMRGKSFSYCLQVSNGFESGSCIDYRPLQILLYFR